MDIWAAVSLEMQGLFPTLQCRMMSVLLIDLKCLRTDRTQNVAAWLPSTQRIKMKEGTGEVRSSLTLKKMFGSFPIASQYQVVMHD